MKNKNVENISNRYLFSIALDYLILMIVLVPLSGLITQENVFIIFAVMCIILVLYLFSDGILMNASIGKRVFSIMVVSGNSDTKLSCVNMAIRKVLEIIYSFKIVFWHLYIDIDRVTNTRICRLQRKYVPPHISKTPKEPEGQDRSLRLRRTKAFIIDFALISWAWIAHAIISIPVIANAITDVSRDLGFWSSWGLSMIITSYFIFKDLVFRNGSIGMHRMGVKIMSADNQIPTTSQIIIRSVFHYGLFPLDAILFAIQKKQVGDIISHTIIISK